MFLIQKKLEPHLVYRTWILTRAVVYVAATVMVLRLVIPLVMNRHWDGLKELGSAYWPFAAAWLVLETVGEKLFSWYFSPRPLKRKKNEKPEKVVPATDKRVPNGRIFYRRATLSHLFPGRPNPVLIGLSEQDEEFIPVFRAYLALRYSLLCFVGLVTILLIAAEPIPRNAIEGILGAFIPYLTLKGLESFMLYLTMGRVMSGEDIHGARTTRFFAFEPTASFQKRLTLPVLDRKPWFVSLYAIVNGWYRLIWWLYRLSFLIVAVLMGQAAHRLTAEMPAVMTPALAICLPAAICYLGLVIERTMAYLLFFPKPKKKKQAKVQSDVQLQEAG